jgi:spermidine synthase
MVCYDDHKNCPQSYLFSKSFRKHLANALNSAIVAVTNKEVLTSPEMFLRKAQNLRECALHVSF